MPTPFRTTRRIEFVDTDMAGIVHFSNFFRFMEAAEVEYLRSLDLSVAMDTPEGRIGFPRVSVTCDYFKPALFQDVLDIQVTIQSVARKAITFGFDFLKKGTTIARGQITTVCCKVLPDHKLESLEIPAEIRTKLEQ